jgi:GNAT superfamily N-acetyltransferase
MTDHLLIRNLLPGDIDQVNAMVPEDWQFDLAQFLSFHYGQPYFYPIAAVSGGTVIGVGNGIMNGQTGWLGNIIVHADFRRKGIGQAITRNLVEYFKNKGCTSQLLVATSMGEGLYRKFGFETCSEYLFYKAENKLKGESDNRIRRLEPKDIDAIMKLDSYASGEERAAFIARFFSAGMVYEDEQSGEILGYYLPACGNGSIIASDGAAGTALLHLKHSIELKTAVIPVENAVARDFLEQNGFVLDRRAPRMIFGSNVDWHPDLVYSRIAGYYG